MRIEVHGIPAPQGSKRHVGGGRMVEQSRAVGPWREAVRAETQRVMQATSVDTLRWLLADHAPVVMDIHFRLPRPKTLPKKISRPAKRPDLDKLVRAVLDGVVAGGALADDAQVVGLVAGKAFAVDGYPPGCVIYIQDPEDDSE